jgi:hypothetical protein
MLVAFLLFGFIGYIAMPTLNMARHSNYDRSGIEKLTDKMFGDAKI